MDSYDTTDYSGWNLTHQTNDKIRIEENAKVTQHDPDFENGDVGDDEDNLEAPHRPILSVNVTKNNDHICQSENLLEGRTRSQPCS